MKVQVSKVFAKFISKATGFAARVETLPERAYRFCTGVEPYDADYYGDYDWATGEYKAIVVTYPDGYYACPRYVTTKELHEEFKRRRIKTAEGLGEMLKDMLTI